MPSPTRPCVRTGRGPAPARAVAGRRGLRGEDGSSTLELVILFPVVLMVIFGLVQGALFYHARNVALSAAQEGVRAARAENGSADDGSRTARGFVDQAGGTNVMTEIGVRPVRTATFASVTVTGRALSVLPGVPGLRVSQTAAGPVERFTVGGP